MKLFLPLLFIFGLHPICFGQSKINQLVNILKTIDNTWTLKLDLSNKAKKSSIYHAKSLGYIILKKDKTEIIYCVYQYLKGNIDSTIHQYQKIASCLTVGQKEKNSILKYNTLTFFLSLYPCWTEYSSEAIKMIRKIHIKFYN